jgi:hypothetical protein
MAIDQRDVSSTLRLMDDRALQQYAAMHKSDPYIFPLAFQESQNRQKIRMSQQTAQGMQPQPKVNEQALAQMAPQPMPEEQGIGALPAGNMETMADGGIAGYPDDDFVTRNQSVVMMAGGGHVPRYQGNPVDGSVVRARGPYGQTPTSMTGDIPGFVAGTPIFQTQPSADEEEPLFRRLLRERQEAVEVQRVQEARTRAAKGQPLSAEDQARISKADTAKTAADTSAQDLAQFDAASNLYMTERAAKQAAAKPAPKSDAAPKADTNRRNITDPSATRKEPAAEKDKDPAGIDALMAKLTRETDLAQGALRNQRVGLASQLEQEALGTKEEGEKRRKERGDVFAGREARLAEREKGVAGLGDKYMGLALLQAGAAMMSTPGNLGSVIGKGIQVGSERYIAGIDKINAAKDKFEIGRAHV